MKMLLIDDEPFALKLLQIQLGNLGFDDLTSVGSGEEAIVLLDGAIDFELIICDLQMPRMDGIELVRYLASIDYEKGIILLSGEDRRILKTAEKLASFYGLNILGALSKPVVPELLGTLLDKKLDKAGIGKKPTKSYGREELERAIKQGELVNYYQPQVIVSTGEVVGVETLVRWQHPTDGVVFPDQFIPLAEQHHLIDDLTRVVLLEAIHQLRRWRDQGLTLDVAVNISRDNLTSLEFPEFVAAAMEAAEIDVRSLTLEVTESQLMRNPLAMLEILTRLRLKYIGLSIDDFGTGHSSLAQLRDIPFDELKIDRSFVHGACRDTSLQAIFEASLTMARNLGIKVVAEGVENLDDWQYLKEVGCDFAQGYLIAKPMPASELKSWMTDWRGVQT